MDGNLVLYDWVSISTSDFDEIELIEFLGFELGLFRQFSGRYGYKERYSYDGVNIYYDGRDDMGVLLEMSGQGCRVFESLGCNDYEKLWALVLSGHGNLTRLDVAYDDHTGVIPLDRLFDDAINMRFVSKAEYYKFEYSSEGKTVYHGSPKSDMRLRIYDKAKERHCDPGTHWVRIELQLRRDYARRFIECGSDIGDCFAGVLLNFVRYVEPQDSDVNRWRWPLTDYWSEFLSDVVKISLYQKPGMEYNRDNLDRFVFHQAGNAIKTALQLYGVEGFLDRVNNTVFNVNPKYEVLLDQSDVVVDWVQELKKITEMNSNST